MTWFLKVSHSIMTSDAPERPPRLAQEELLENQEMENDHATDVLPILHLIGQRHWIEGSFRGCRGSCHSL